MSLKLVRKAYARTSLAMGCLMAKMCDPSNPDASVRNFWHIRGVVIDSAEGGSQVKNRSRAGSANLDVNSATSASTPANPNGNGNVVAKAGTVQRRPAGVLYVYNGRLIYRARRCALSRNAKSLELEMCDIQDVTCRNNFTSHKSVHSGQVVDIVVGTSTTTTSGSKSQTPLHIGFFTPEAEEVSRTLSETCMKHRQKPKIFQFNSVDVEGVEIDLP